MKNLKKLDRKQLKNVMGGRYNENCGDSNPTADYTCCKATFYVHIGETDCQSASAMCGSGMITNDPSRCN